MSFLLCVLIAWAIVGFAAAGTFDIDVSEFGERIINHKKRWVYYALMFFLFGPLTWIFGIFIGILYLVYLLVSPLWKTVDGTYRKVEKWFTT